MRFVSWPPIGNEDGFELSNNHRKGMFRHFTSIDPSFWLILCLIGGMQTPGDAWGTRTHHNRKHPAPIHPSTIPRRAAFLKVATSVALVSSVPTSSAQALVKGNAPPNFKAKAGGSPKCTNIDECQALAAEREEQAAAAAAADLANDPVQVTPAGTRFRDLQTGSGSTARNGDQVEVYYKVLKLGKRSYDGLSGEGTVVFSRGYGLEDDEREAREKSFTTVLGSYSNIPALNDAVAGMQVGGVRRFAVLPDKGWRKAGRACDGGPGGSGTGGELKTDYVVVPTATMVAEEACFDNSKQPFPSTFAQQRRMAQRFDQSLIVEVELVKVSAGDTSLL